MSMSERSAVQFRVLGPVELHTAAGPVEVGPPRQRSVLAALVVDAGWPVTADTLVDRVWGQAAPDGVRRALHVYIARLRRLIGAATTAEGAPRLVRRSGGYLLDTDPGRVDLHSFRSLVEQARDPECDDPRRAHLLRGALALWRGTPLTGLSGDWAERVRAGWQQQRLEATVSWAQTELRLGNPGAVTGPLIDLAADHPLVEPLTAVLMRALYATGRSAEALNHYTKTRHRLAEELGVDAGSELQRLQQAILRGEPDPWPIAQPAADSGPSASAPRVGASDTVPAQLPLDVYGFTGRSGELGQLDAVLAAAGLQPTAAVVAVLSGMAGVGKTALAVHWAHQVAHRFPDGQLYVNLRGFDADASVVSPAQAVRGFLDAFAVPPQRIPATVEAQVGLYRSMLAGRRVLVVLDNARDADHVRPLLPGAPGCLAVVTSRSQLAGLVAGQGAHPLSLGLLSAAESRDLLARRAGLARMGGEESATDQIIVHCAQLPLALAIVAARLANDPALSLAALAQQLAVTRGGLDAFDGDDAATDVRKVFSWSYRSLSPGAARLFRLLGLHPGPDISPAAAASLAATPLEQTHAHLAELARANLVIQQAGGRASSHDLLRAYANELAVALDSAAERQAARHRLLDHYLHSADAATGRLYPHRDVAELAPVQPGVAPEIPVDDAQALAWVAAERPALLAAIADSGATGMQAYTWRLATALTEYLDRRGHWQQWRETHTAALQAAVSVADLEGQAQAHRGLGRACIRLGLHDEALPHFTAVLELYTRLGDYAGQAKAHRGLARLLDLQGRFEEALEHAVLTLEGYKAAGHESGQANSLNMIGWYHCELGNYHQALACCQEALNLLRDLGDRHGQAATLDSLGYAYHHLGEHQQAVRCYTEAFDLHHDLGDRYQETVVLTHLGDTHQAAGDHDAAAAAWRRALVALERLGHPDADHLRARLADEVLA
jgi:DNA-binding SARP family transcriptional activator/tetratricopeptide (TPR) repeat protein